MNAPHELNGMASEIGSSDAAERIRPLPGEAGIPNVEERVRQPSRRRGCWQLACWCSRSSP